MNRLPLFDGMYLDFWRVIEVDNMLSEKLVEESDRNRKMGETYEIFKEHYNYT